MTTTIGPYPPWPEPRMNTTDAIMADSSRMLRTLDELPDVSDIRKMANDLRREARGQFHVARQSGHPVAIREAEATARRLEQRAEDIEGAIPPGLETALPVRPWVRHAALILAGYVAGALTVWSVL